jgi:hypothetical protein
VDQLRSARIVCRGVDVLCFLAHTPWVQLIKTKMLVNMTVSHCDLFSIDLGREHFFLNGPWRPTDLDKKGKKERKKRMHLVPNRVLRPQQLVKWSFTFSQGDGFVSPIQYIYIYNIHTAKSTAQPLTPLLLQPYRSNTNIPPNSNCTDTHLWIVIFLLSS